MRVLVVFTSGLLVILSTISNTWAALPHHHFPNKRQADYAASLGSYEVITPLRVDGEGKFISHHLHETHESNRRAKRSTLDDDHNVHYVVTLDGSEHQISLRPNSNFLAPHAVVERHASGSGQGRKGMPSLTKNLQVVGNLPSCHFHGYIANHTFSKVAISTCDGLTGFVQTDFDEYLIEPIRDHVRPSIHHPHPHLVYKRSALPTADTHTCSTSDAYSDGLRTRSNWEKAERRRKRSTDTSSQESTVLPRKRSANSPYQETSWRTKRRSKRRKRSVSVERNVEVTVVADKKMVDYYSNEDITTYILTVMNMVSSVYHDASIGNAVNIYIVRIMLLEDPQYEEELDISHNADNTLRSFCTWQQMINPGNETHPYHHDVAVLITRYNICSRMTERCSTLGVAEIAGMCQPLRSCNVNEDTGLQIAYTIAHELGHNFGMNHDGPQNGCESQYGVSQHVMSPHLTSEPIPVTWSNCSRKEITHFLDREWGTCLEDEPPQVEYDFPELPPGAMYDADHQCRLSFGANATHCSGIEGIERVCQTLWCHRDNRCITRMEPAAEGTKCGVHKWCAMGQCVPIGERPAAIHGNWGSWSSWSECSRTCGAGTSYATRHCDNPAPANGGRYCTGDRRRHRICNTEDCPENGVSFRGMQCSAHDKQLYKGAYHTWQPVMFDESSCNLDCKPDNEFYSVKLQDSVLDGTPCKPGTRNMCIHGMCKRVTCDWNIEGSAQEDRCGLCHGDGTQCITYRGEFNMTTGSGYVTAVTFPKDARNVRINEFEDAANYLAIKDNTTEEYFLNGNWIIQWSGEYHADGTMMYYTREGETEELYLPGPLKRPLTLQLLFQTENPGLEWEYTLPHENATYTPEFTWEHSDWSVCSVTCGGGNQISKVQCMEKEAGLVEDKYCINQTRPDDLSRICNTHACPAWWWSGPWQPCSVTCGTEGTRRRTVICVRSFGPTEQMALLDSDCNNNEKPHEFEMCGTLPACPELQDWKVGSWNQACSADPCDFEERQVVCVAAGKNCDPLTRPAEKRQCGNITCGHWDVGEWSKCSAPCGDGAQFRRVSCIGGLACRETDEPVSFQNCTGECLEEETLLENEEEHGESIAQIPSEEMPSAIATSAISESDPTTIAPLQPEFTPTPNSLEETIIETKPSMINSTVSPFTVDANENFVTQQPLFNHPILTNGKPLHPTKEENTSINSIESSKDTSKSLPNEDISLDTEIESLEESEGISGENSRVQDNVSVEGVSKNQDITSSNMSSEVKDNVIALDVSIKNGIPIDKNSVIQNHTDLVNEHIPSKSVDEHDELESINLEEPEMISSKETTKLPSNSEVGSEETTKNQQEKESHSAKNSESNTVNHDSNSDKKVTPIEESEGQFGLDMEPIDVEDESANETNLQSDNAINDDYPQDRPDGIIEDKIILEDFEVIEVIEVPAEGKRKKDKKKVVIHTGEEAVNVLHDLAENQSSKKSSTTPVPEDIVPKYKWIVGDWSECNAECGGGIQSRAVSCTEEESGQSINPELCSDEMPSHIQACNEMECGEWIVGEWEECSSKCDVGERLRPVECPTDKICPTNTQPPEVEPCNLGPCTQWVEGPWSLCTRSCGGGYQIRHVKCVDIRTQEASRSCPKDTKPKHKMSCHNQRCTKRERGQQRRCKDHMDTKLCKRLKHMCSTNFFRVKCCRTCFKRHLLAKASAAGK